MSHRSPSPLRLSGRRCLPAAALGASVLALAGCGLALGPAPSAVQLLVTSSFGAHVLHRGDERHTSSGETVQSMLTRSYPVRTGPGGRQVQSIDGLAAGTAAVGRASAWSYYVNGVQVHEAPAARKVNPGDHVWWDLHEGGPAPDTSAVVGSFPEPFLNGVSGKRLPVRIECTPVSHAACDTVTRSLRGVGVPAAVSAIGSGGAPETLRVMVGPWPYLQGDLEAESIAFGPGASGVYVRIAHDGGALTLLDEHRRAVRTLRAGAGLIAATTAPKEAPVWVITGTDTAGVQLAAGSLDRAALEDRFAVAFDGGAAFALPQPTPSGR